MSPPDVNESMWSWVNSTDCFEKLAILNRSPVLSVAAKMRTVAMGARKVNVFTSFDEATAWLKRTEKPKG